MTSTTPTSRIPMLLATAVVFSLALSGCGAPGPSASVPSTAPAGARTTPLQSPSVPGALAIGQTSSHGDLRVTVTSIANAGSFEGRPVLAVTVTYENLGTRALAFDESDWAVQIADSPPSTAKAVTQTPTLGAGDVAPGAKKTGTIDFKCPGRVLKVIFSADDTSTVWVPGS
jgi:hypothetical protein